MTRCGHKVDGECKLGLHGGRPSDGVCGRCASYDGPARGLGDRVAVAIKVATGGRVGPCSGCARRIEALNRTFPSAADR